ncbi:MAG: hypothetical protein OXB88_11590 [Bacteriovoracales bacterium]|nr:hypothetical protein [Bacteriovoracales bacterium]
MKITYKVDENYSPLLLDMEKKHGTLFSKEIFTPGQSMDKLTYKFKSKNSKKEIEIQTPNEYHLACPATCSTLIFSKKEKFNSVISKNFNIITSGNIWEYKRSPEIRTLSLKCLNPTEKENLTISKKSLNGTRFEVFSKNRGKWGDKISYFISSDHAIPYQIIVDKNIKIEIDTFKKVLNSKLDQRRRKIC